MQHNNSPSKRHRSRRFGSILLPPVDPDAYPPTARRLTVVPEPGPLSYAPLSQIIGDIDISTMYTEPGELPADDMYY